MRKTSFISHFSLAVWLRYCEFFPFSPALHNCSRNAVLPHLPHQLLSFTPLLAVLPFTFTIPPVLTVFTRRLPVLSLPACHKLLSWDKCKNLGGLDFKEFNNVINWSRESFMYIIEPPRWEQSSSASSCQRGCAVSVLGEFPDLTIVKSWATWSKFGVELVLHRMLGKALANQDPFPLELFCNYLRISWNPVRNSQWKSHFGPPKRDSSTDSPEGTVPGAV